MARFYMNRRTTKPTKWPLRPAKTQISLDIRPHEETLGPQLPIVIADSLVDLSAQVILFVL